MACICCHAIELMWDVEIQTGSNCPTSATTYQFKFLILGINLVPILRQLNYQYTTTPWIDYRNCSQGTRRTTFQMQQQMKIDHCTEEPVTILSSGQYCRMCYAKLKHKKIEEGKWVLVWKSWSVNILVWDVGGASSLFVRNVGVIMIIIIDKINIIVHIKNCINILVSIVIFLLISNG